MNRERIIVFGRGNYYLNKKRELADKYEVIAFLDNAIEDCEKEDDSDISAYNPCHVDELPDCYILCMSGDYFSMWKQLISLGVKDERIKFGYEVGPLQEGLEKIAFSKGEKLYSRQRCLLYESEMGRTIEIKSSDGLKALMRDILRRDNCDIDLISNLTTYPVSTVFGSDRGKAVDRKYIEDFLFENSDCIEGTVLEVLNDNYTRRFGGDKVSDSVVSHVKGWGKNSILCNFETGEGVIPEAYDCIICTQTLQYIFDVKSAIKNIYSMLKPGGSALVTVPGIKPLCEYDDNNWGEYWSFTIKSMTKLFDGICDGDEIQIKQHGNVKTATAYLYGICAEELKESDFKDEDPRYPFIITVKVKKKNR